MSWLPNPFKSLQLYADDDSLSESGDEATAGSVKEDLSAIGETISRQLLGVAAFLAPPPPASSPSAVPSSSSAVAADDSGDSMSPTFARIRSDLAELGGSFKSSLSLLSNTKAVSEFSKIASNFLKLDELEDDEEEEVEDDRGVGVTDSVVRFVTDISQRPECWTDFPLSLNHGFTMSQAQAAHVAVIVDMVPSLADLRVRLSSEMSANRFWMIYFILLLPRLNRDSVDLLSTPEIVETRSALLNMMLNTRSPPPLDSQKDHIDNSSQSDTKLDQDKHDSNSSGEKAAVVGVVEPSTDVELQEMNAKRSKEGDATSGSVQNEDDISFSDLEDDDTDLSTRRRGSGIAQDAASSSPEASSEWVRLKKNVDTGGGKSKEDQLRSQNRDSEGEESSDWLTIDDFDDN